jgi:hypothetical protein
MIHSNVRQMTLGNMRANGVGSLLVYCFACHHEAVFGIGGYPDDVPVPTFAPRMVCTRRHDRRRRAAELERKAQDALAGGCRQVSIEPIIPVVRRGPFDDPGWLFELKWECFRGVADTVNGRMLSRCVEPPTFPRVRLARPSLCSAISRFSALPLGLRRRAADRFDIGRDRFAGAARDLPD